MISKDQLDEYYTEHYDRLHKIITGIVIKNKSKVPVETILSECYLNMLQKLDKIHPDKIGHFITSYARLGTRFSNNPLAKEVHYNYIDKDWTQNFSEKLFEGYEPDEYFNYIDENIQTDIIEEIDGEKEKKVEKYSQEWLLQEIEKYSKTLNIVDKLAIPLLFDSIVYKTIDYKEYGIEDRDISLYKEILKRIKTELIKKYSK